MFDSDLIKLFQVNYKANFEVMSSMQSAIDLIWAGHLNSFGRQFVCQKLIKQPTEDEERTCK